MRCIIVDDEPIARRGMERLVAQASSLTHVGSFDSAESASAYLENNPVDLVFLDIQMPGVNGLEFAKDVPKATLIIFTTAFAEFALDSYTVDAVDYLVKPITSGRFQRAVSKATAYHGMLLSEERNTRIEQVESQSMFIRSERRFFKVNFADILFIEGLKDYVVIQNGDKRLITHMNLKGIHGMLPQSQFLRVNRSYIVNKQQIDSFSNNDVFIGPYEIAIGSFYQEAFLAALMGG
ncbi:LytR/AlgR family response regulator transcription factor [Parapedobacter sp. 10938]|uniref:LytR/AlgR family response regulator transcription factor n=1 Tax=Parapedobacter flavus TaxID=3110225 RepID=UPI002DBADFD7|nr:LytTR family DNA-binding domain-containing protein [Parapedobacter sp. 10938]MEC3878790.1 LytTR family DNA-binding domain-containing protein [Parapedobacter sp. 10938]